MLFSRIEGKPGEQQRALSIPIQLYFLDEFPRSRPPHALACKSTMENTLKTYSAETHG